MGYLRYVLRVVCNVIYVFAYMAFHLDTMTFELELNVANNNNSTSTITKMKRTHILCIQSIQMNIGAILKMHTAREKKRYFQW